MGIWYIINQILLLEMWHFRDQKQKNINIQILKHVCLIGYNQNWNIYGVIKVVRIIIFQKLILAHKDVWISVF